MTWLVGFLVVVTDAEATVVVPADWLRQQPFLSSCSARIRYNRA
jgi:hypothetical protein